MGCGRRWASNSYGRSWGRRRTEELGNGQGGGEDVSPAKPSARKLQQVNHSEHPQSTSFLLHREHRRRNFGYVSMSPAPSKHFAPAAAVCQTKRPIEAGEVGHGHRRRRPPSRSVQYPFLFGQPCLGRDRRKRPNRFAVPTDCRALRVVQSMPRALFVATATLAKHARPEWPQCIKQEKSGTSSPQH